MGTGPIAVDPRHRRHVRRVRFGIRDLRSSAVRQPTSDAAAVAARLGVGEVLLASCYAKAGGGGLVAIDTHGVRVLDALDSTGMCLAGDRILRAVRNPDDPEGPGEILIYTSDGLERRLAPERLIDPHDVMWDGSAIVVVSTMENRILWLDLDGRIEREWVAPGERDSWHLNGLRLHNGSVLVCCFGRFDRHREWLEHADRPCGVVFDLDTGRDVITGLVTPHQPRFTAAGWVVCNSARHSVVVIDADSGQVGRCVRLNGWTRGLEFTSDAVFVGVSAKRGAKPQGRASVVALDRQTWKPTARVELPCEEIYDLLRVPVELVPGLEVFASFSGNHVDQHNGSVTCHGANLFGAGESRVSPRA